MRITKLSQQKRDKNYLNIFIDGVFSFTTDVDSIIRLKLHTNQELTQEELENTIKEVDFARWYNSSLRLISRRPRAIQEVKDYLSKHEVGETTQSMVVERLLERKYLNDEVFTQWFIEQRNFFRPKGARALAYELRQKGIAQDVINKVLDKNTLPQDEYEKAKTISSKKLVMWKSLPSEKQKQKLVGFLGRRGFSWDVISPLLKLFFPS